MGWRFSLDSIRETLMHHANFLGVLLLIWLVWVFTKPSVSSGTRYQTSAEDTSEAYERGFKAGTRYKAE